MRLISEEIDDYSLAHTTRPDPLFDDLAEETRNGFRYHMMQVGPVEGTLLKTLVAISGARRIVEIGTFTGYSALMMASALPDDGQLIACDVDPESAAVAQKYFDRSPHGRKIELRIAPALETLATLEGPLDMVFIDADKENYSSYYDRCLELLRPGGLLVADNCLWSARVLDPKEPSDHALVAFNRKVAADPRVEHVLLTVRDGVMLARKR